MKRGPLAILLTLLAAAVLTLCMAKTSYATQDRDHIAEDASSRHWSGTDDLGRDRTVRLAGALLLGLAGAVSASGLATLLAVVVGMTAAFTHRRVAGFLIYASDLLLTLPWLFLLMIIRSAMPLTIAPARSAFLTFLMLGLLSWPAYVRLTYANAASIWHSQCMIQGRAMGLRKRQLAWRYVFPHLRPLTMSLFLMLVPACLVAEANLGTLGLGVSEPLPSFGSMLLGLQHSAMFAASRWSYAPIVLLIGVLSAMEMLVGEV